MGTELPDRIGHFRVVRMLGRGGMGVVYAAHDERLDRPVALKLIAGPETDDVARQRFWREARAAARVSHPNICQLFEIGQHRDTLFIAMELLQGESLAERIARGPMPPSEAIPIALDMLAALDALHAERIVHRDLKPSNVFLGARAVKLLDFGLATFADMSLQSGETASALTRSGTIAGTPRYMAPEQLRGSSGDPRIDLFAAGAILFEMLAGRPAFPGDTIVDVWHAIAFEDAPGFQGGAAADAANAILKRALARDPADRYPSASAMADDMRRLRAEDAVGLSQAPSKSWLLVLPFRVVRADPDAELLAFGLADAVTSSLAGLQSLGVRSSAVAARFREDVPDLTRIARDAQVDLVLTGALMHANQQIRVNTQLMAVPSGTLLWSHNAQVTLRDVFQVQDEIVQRIVSSLPMPLTTGERRLLQHDVPATATAYEYYLRANQVTAQSGLASVDAFAIARELYTRSLEEDPRYAPAWARLGRCCRVIAKAGDRVTENLAEAESCLQRALDLNPELAIAHTLYGQLEADLGRSRDALLRLTARAVANGSDPDVFAGLVLACRYCGQLEASVAAHERARRLDPHVATSVRHTYWLLGDDVRALQEGQRFYFEAMVLASADRHEDALDILREGDRAKRPALLQDFLSSLRALLEGRREESLAATERCIAAFRDPEPLFYLSRQLSYLGETERAIEELHHVLDRGYLCSQVLARDRWLGRARERPEFAILQRRAIELQQQTADFFVECGTARLLAVSPAR
jgi:serine/threonine protein kinase